MQNVVEQLHVDSVVFQNDNLVQASIVIIVLMRNWGENRGELINPIFFRVNGNDCEVDTRVDVHGVTVWDEIKDDVERIKVPFGNWHWRVVMNFSVELVV